MRRQFRQLRVAYPAYWNRPVPPVGPHPPALLIVGLAPGKHGANKSGQVFTGDASGQLLFKVLGELNLTNRVSITNAVKCLPVKNLPATTEINNCRRFLEIELLGTHTILALGGVAHKAILQALGLIPAHFPFGHGAEHDLGDRVLVDSYHCSRYNTQTGRLTETMFTEVVALAGRHAGLIT